MAIKVTSKTVSRIGHVGKTQPKVDPKAMAAALGAEAEDAAFLPPPHELQHVARQLADRLESRGGRPGLEGAERRQKIPLTSEDWSSLERIARRLSRPGHRVSPGQAASALLHEKLQEVARGD